MKIIIPVIFTIIAIGLMLAALHFSKYKKRTSGCCGGHACGDHPDKTCDEDDSKSCTCEKE